MPTLPYTKPNIANLLRSIKQSIATSSSGHFHAGTTNDKELAAFTERMVDDGYITAYQIRRDPNNIPTEFVDVKITAAGEKLMQENPVKLSLTKRAGNVWNRIVDECKKIGIVLGVIIAAATIVGFILAHFFTQPKEATIPPNVIAPVKASPVLAPPPPPANKPPLPIIAQPPPLAPKS